MSKDVQEKRLDTLVELMKADSVQYADMEVPKSYEEKRMLLRSLMNIRTPKVVPQELIFIQDDFLLEEANEKGCVGVSEIPTIKEAYKSKHPHSDILSVWQGDITRLAVDAIVNAANSQMLGCFVPCHKCIDNAIHSAAGMQLREECNHIMSQKKIQFGNRYEEPTGTAVLTKGYNLPAEYVIHTVGPIVGYQLTESLRQGLRNCYRSVLKCAVDNNIRSVAFCCISTGEFRFPNDEAAHIAVEEVTKVLDEYKDHFDRIIFNVFKDIDLELYIEELSRV